MFQLPENFEKMKWACVSGEMTTLDASIACGMKLSTFYKKLREDRKAFEEFQRNDSKRRKLVTQNKDVVASQRDYRRQEHEMEIKMVEVMKQYHSDSLSSKLRNARAMGVSYGYYSAMCAGLGRLSNG